MWKQISKIVLSRSICNESKCRSSHHERNSPNNVRSSGKCSRSRSQSRERTAPDRNGYYRSKGERTRSRERYYQDAAQRWEKGRHCNDSYSSHGTRDGRERESSHCDKDFDKSSQAYNNRSPKDHHCKSRWPHNALSGEEAVHRFSSHRANFQHCSIPPQPCEKYSRERHALPPVSAYSNFEDASRENEKDKLRHGKRKHTHKEGSGGETEKKCRKTGDRRMKNCREGQGEKGGQRSISREGLQVSKDSSIISHFFLILLSTVGLDSLCQREVAP